MQCLGRQLAYNQMGFVLVRLLQTFSSVELAPDCQPAGSLPLDDWKSAPGRQSIEKVWPIAAIGTYVKAWSVRGQCRRSDRLQGGLWVRFKQADDSGCA